MTKIQLQQLRRTRKVKCLTFPMGTLHSTLEFTETYQKAVSLRSETLSAFQVNNPSHHLRKAWNYTVI